MGEPPDYPVIVEPDGNIKLKTDKMVVDQLYHCISDNKVYLFFKDEQEMLNCYEVSDPEVVREIAERPSDLESILRAHSSK